MNYQEKYLKYKNKYLTLKQNGGFKYKCPDHKPHLCEAPTNYMGVCVKHENYCNTEYKEGKSAIPDLIWEEGEEDLKKRYEFGIAKGYINDNLNQSCLKQTDAARITEIENGQKITGPFSILTLNVMGICRNPDQIEFARLRAELLKKEILDKQPDILCFQEMSQPFLDFLYSEKIREIYPYIYESIIITEGKKDIDCSIISKYKPTKIIMQNLDGVLKHSNSLQIIEFENLVIFNCYLQSGSKASPGQITKWMHYSRCRAQYFDYIKKIIKQYENKGIILLGDLNFNLNGTHEEWPELIYLQKIGLHDSWSNINPDTPGLTEDSNINSMRWNSKFEIKEYRYDAILYNELLKPIESTIFGNESSKLIEDDNILYERVIIPSDKIHDSKLKKAGTYTDSQGNEKNEYDLFISDHFGVLSKFEHI